MNTEGNGQPEDQHVLNLLDAVEKKADISQRGLSKHMGVALGLTNSYLKRCIRKGWIKITTAPANRYLYYLTPKGFAEKSRLTRQYLTYSLTFYREAADSCQRLFNGIDDSLDSPTAIFVGRSDLAEIASIRANDKSIEILGTYDTNPGSKRFLGKPVWTEVESMPPADFYILTELEKTEDFLSSLESRIEPSKILVPDILTSVVSSKQNS